MSYAIKKVEVEVEGIILRRSEQIYNENICMTGLGIEPWTRS